MKRFMVLTVVIALLLGACASAGAPAAVTPQPAPSETPQPTEALPNTGPKTVDLPPAQLKALEALAAALGVSPDAIRVVEAQAIEWPDACLGVQRMGVLCAQGITPGFRVVLEANGKQYEYHTNQDGSVVVEAALGEVGGEDAALKSAIEMLAQALGIPAGEIKVAANSTVEWPDACLGVAQPGVMCAQVVTPGRSIVLEANGKQYEFHTNQDGSVVLPATLALTWHREGGIAGFCDDLAIFLPKAVAAASCKAEPVTATLTAEEQAQLEQWLDDYGQVAIEMKDPATADAMTTRLALYGRGEAQPVEAERQAILDWAQAVYNRAKP